MGASLGEGTSLGTGAWAVVAAAVVASATMVACGDLPLEPDRIPAPTTLAPADPLDVGLAARVGGAPETVD